jgi:hypothetical protein
MGWGGGGGGGGVVCMYIQMGEMGWAEIDRLSEGTDDRDRDVGQSPGMEMW